MKATLMLLFASLSAHAGDLLLKDYKPVSQLKFKAHVIKRARFPVVDVHNHVNDAHPNWGDEVPVKELLERMDALGIAKIAILTGKWGEALQKVLDATVKLHPDRFTVFTEIDWSRVDEVDFAEKMATQIEDSVKRGARGLKIMKDFGLEVKFKGGQLLKIDDPKLNAIWEVCGRLGVPVAIHVGDPDAFFEPITPANERYEELARYPEWSFHGNSFPSKRALIDALERVFRAHPKTIFVSLHAGNWPENLDYVSELLRTHPNVYVEFGARQAELGRQPSRTRKFMIEFQDRVLFGTDATPEAQAYQSYFRWLETDDDYFEPYAYPAQGRWMIYGLSLPGPVLKKIYGENAKKLFARFRGFAR